MFRREGISPSLRLLVPTFLLPHAPAWLTPLPSQREWNTLLPLIDFIEEGSAHLAALPMPPARIRTEILLNQSQMLYLKLSYGSK